MKNKEKEKEEAGKCDEMLPSGHQKGETEKFEMKAKTRLACRLVHAAAFQTTANEIFSHPAAGVDCRRLNVTLRRGYSSASDRRATRHRHTNSIRGRRASWHHLHHWAESGASHPGECGAAILSAFSPHTRTHTNTCGGRQSSHATPTQSVTEVPDI